MTLPDNQRQNKLRIAKQYYHRLSVIINTGSLNARAAGF